MVSQFLRKLLFYIVFRRKLRSFTSYLLSEGGEDALASSRMRGYPSPTLTLFALPSPAGGGGCCNSFVNLGNPAACFSIEAGPKAVRWGDDHGVGPALSLLTGQQWARLPHLVCGEMAVPSTALTYRWGYPFFSFKPINLGSPCCADLETSRRIESLPRCSTSFTRSEMSLGSRAGR
jgi:hypothetical protein